MKNLPTVLAWIPVILLIIFGFLLSWQKKQNDHDEQIMKLRIDFDNSKQVQNVGAVDLKEKLSVREKIWMGIKSFATFCLRIWA